MGMVQGAVYDAVNAITPKHHRPYLLNRRFGNTASDDAAVATAAYLVLKNSSRPYPEHHVPDEGNPACVTRDAVQRVEERDTRLAVQGSGDRGRERGGPGHARRERGRWTVRAVSVGAEQRAGTLVAASKRPADPRPDAVGGRREAVPHAELVAVPQRGHRPRSTAPQWAAEFNEVKSLGRATGSTRTDDQTYIARWWQSAPGLSWNDVARQLIARNDLDAADSARLLALQNLAAADAAINCWNDKYHFDFWRPWNAIPRAVEDGNAATDARPDLDGAHHRAVSRVASGHNWLDGRTPPCCGCSSATRPQAASRSRAPS